MEPAVIAMIIVIGLVGWVAFAIMYWLYRDAETDLDNAWERHKGVMERLRRNATRDRD